ncbi:glutamyl-tRNA reductase [Leucobacter sp. gxy201]|uniref:glutamyl-tRNA reductase n=1 Tax=Leucobacter sp. gxy201 TaxID=2957200 RepID=UPI003DA03B89
MLLCFSADHRTTPTPELERFERRGDAIAAALRAHEAVAGSIVLATCNRFEAYADIPSATSEAVLSSIADAAGLETAAIRRIAACSTDEAAAEHLFAVACGLESAALGEGEIAGQVRRAHARAHEQQSVTDLLERLFQRAHRVARDVKHRTGLQDEGRSLVRLALALAERRIGSWERARVLLVGTGAYAGATVAALRGRGAERIAVHSPSGRAAEFARARGIRAVPEHGFADALASADLLIACSSVHDPLLHARDLGDVETPPPLVLDLGMPRNIDADVTSVAGVELLDLEAIAKHAPVPELGAAAEARRIVHDAAIEFSSDRAEREALPALVALRGHVLDVLEDELCRARGPRTPGDAEASAVELALRRFTGRLLHEPSERIRALGRAGRSAEARRAAETLFGPQ